MQLRKTHFLILMGLGVLMLAGFLLLLPVTQAAAQCGSQASSCKSCHETQAQKPVNNDGTGWHTGHAFGDFCYACHGGNNQSTNKDEAHTGMVPPLSDIKTACQGCHPNDLNERAQKYADVLGVKLGESAASGSAQPTQAQPTEKTTPAAAGSTDNSGSTGGTSSSAPSGSGVVVDYAQQYAETVEGKLNINWGNVILVVLILVVAVGGGIFVFYNERKRRGLPLVAKSEKKPATEASLPVIEGYPSEVVALLPLLVKLNPMGLHSLKRILQNPEQANELLHSLAQLDPELVKRIRALDRDSRELLLAIAGD
jgi:cytochrome c553